MKTKPETMIKALRILANEIESDDGVANACISDAADMIEEMTGWIDGVSRADYVPDFVAHSAKCLLKKDAK